MTNLYDVLGIDSLADDATIQKAYRRKAARLHPDRFPADPDAKARFEELQLAYEVLSDPARRKLYDETGEVETDARRGPELAVTVLMAFFPQALKYMGETGRQPARFDVVRWLTTLLTKERRTAQIAIDNAATFSRIAKETAERLPKGHVLHGVADAQLSVIEADVEACKKSVAGLDAALEVLKDCPYVTERFGMEMGFDAAGPRWQLAAKPATVKHDGEESE